MDDFIIRVDFFDGEKWEGTIDSTFVIPPVIGDRIRIGAGTYEVKERFIHQGVCPIISADINVIRVK